MINNKQNTITENRSEVEGMICQYFNVEFYLSQSESPDPAEINDLIMHYIEVGAAKGLDPAPWFSTDYYRKTNVDVAAAEIDPFTHFLLYGHLEGRAPLPNLENLSLNELADLDLKNLRRERKAVAGVDKKDRKSSEFRNFLDKCLEEFKQQRSGSPKVSVIVPNYNHREFLAERLDSILYQSFESTEIIVLDDASTDGSEDVIKEYQEKFPNRIKFIPNTQNSGNVFKQWRKGFDQCQGDFVWICESDDSAETDFLEKLVPAFDDLAVMIAFCKIQFIDSDSREIEGLDAYRERAESNIWGSNRSGPAAAWFSGSFSVHNIIPNVGGCLIRRQEIEDSIWQTAQEFSILGDWFLYLALSRGGKLAYVCDATTYFRQHGANTSVKSFKGERYYQEHEKLAINVKSQWNITEDTTWRFYKQLNDQFDSVFKEDGSIFDHISLDRVLGTKRNGQHILIGFLGFHVGGGEYFPIFIANALVRNGINVSMLALDVTDVNSEMYSLLDSRIPVYAASDVRGMGSKEFLKQTGVTLINSHHIGVEGLFFLELGFQSDIPYVVTLHGTYEVAEVDEYHMTKIVRNVDHWMYTADKNLRHLRKRSWAKAEVTKLPNATPVDHKPCHITREVLGVNDDAFVFILVSRPVKEKGWEEAINSFIELQKTQSNIVLLLVGESEYQEDLEDEYADIEDLYFLGFQANIHGLMRMSDCCLLPTRFPGESYPLILIQALQNGLPCVSTDIGEIPNIIVKEGMSAGVLIEHQHDDFQNMLTDAMSDIQDKEIYAQKQQTACAIGESYCIDLLADSYLKIFSELHDKEANCVNEEEKTGVIIA